MSSIRDFIDSLNKPAAELPDPEDDDNEEGTWARRPRNNEKDICNEVFMGRRNLLASNLEADTRYEGEKVSAKNVFSGEEICGLARRAESDDEGSLSSNSTPERRSSDEAEENDLDALEVETSNELEDNESGVEEESETGESTEGGASEVEEALTVVNLDSQSRKAESIQQQLKVWDQLLHLLIKLHAALRAFNQLPRGKLAKKLLKSASKETVRNYGQVRERILTLLEVLLKVEDALLKGSVQTKSILDSDVKSANEDDSDDEEIPSSNDEDDNGNHKKMETEVSDDDDEGDDGVPDHRVTGCDDLSDDNEKEESRQKRRKFRFLKQLEVELAKRHQRFEKFRSATLEKWDGRTRLVGVGAAKAAKKNYGSFESVILDEIRQIMNDKQRLIRRTQMKRSDIERIGGNPEASRDVEVFDDDDFYQKILKDLIERKSAQIVDPVEMSRQWLEVQKLRQRRAKKNRVDTKASKGRKIRYVVIPKLVNYFPSMPESVSWSHEMRNELFNSLFSA